MKKRIQLYQECSVCKGTGVTYKYDWKGQSTDASPQASTCQNCGGSGYETTPFFFFKLTSTPNWDNFESEPE